MATPQIAAILLAAGRGARAGSPDDGPKQYRNIGGKAVLARTIEAFLSHGAIDKVLCLIHPDDRELFENAVGNLARIVTVVEGGSTRQASTLNGLRALDAAPDFVMVHDAARPFVSPELLYRIVGALDDKHGVLPALTVSDTIKTATPDGMVAATVDRSTLHAAQTPQAFPFARILAAHEKAASENRMDFTDDSAIAEWAGIEVRLVVGAAENIKLTWPKDIEMADLKLSGAPAPFPDVRTGTGYDVHCFGEGDHVTLCGVEIPFDKTLSGHSDADVGLHALTDALLATCGAGDIGTHFPPSDPQWKGASSHIFLAHAAQCVREAGGRIANADITIIAEAPKVGPHRDAMTARIADILNVAQDRVSVKATTNEKLGFVGREEGIAAIASASVIYPGSVPQ